MTRLLSLLLLSVLSSQLGAFPLSDLAFLRVIQRSTTPPPPDDGGATNLPTPLAFWRMQETSNTRSNSVTNAMHLLDVTSVSAAAGVVSNAAVFVSGDYDYLYVTTDELNLRGTQVEISGWCRRDASGYADFLNHGDQNNSEGEWALAISSGNNPTFVVYDADGSTPASVTSGVTITNNAWFFFSAAFTETSPSSGTLRLVVNRTTNTATVPFRPATNLTTSTFLALSSDGTQPYDLRLDALAFFRTNLTHNQLTNLYNNALGREYYLGAWQ
jgi:hypothetical protein